MERKNTVLLTVIAVATLLVAVVGATFAYFTATTQNAGDLQNNKFEAETAKLANIKLTGTETSKSNNKVWPGTMNYVGVSVAASIDEDETAENKTYEITYTVAGEITLSKSFTQNVKWRLFELDVSSSNPVTCTPVQSENVGNEVQFHQECNQDETFSTEDKTGNMIDSGVITEETSTTISVANRKIETGKTKYYYLVVEYPNNAGGEQNDDQDKTITLSLNSVTATSTAEKSA